MTNNAPRPSDLIKMEKARARDRKRRSAVPSQPIPLTGYVPVPLPDYLLVKRMMTASETSGGIQLTQEYVQAHRPSVGKVIAAGSECKLLDPGDLIVMSPMDGIEIMLPTGPDARDEPWVFIRESGVVGLWVSHQQISDHDDGKKTE